MKNNLITVFLLTCILFLGFLMGIFYSKKNIDNIEGLQLQVIMITSLELEKEGLEKTLFKLNKESFSERSVKSFLKKRISKIEEMIKKIKSGIDLKKLEKESNKGKPKIKKKQIKEYMALN